MLCAKIPSVGLGLRAGKGLRLGIRFSVMRNGLRRGRCKIIGAIGGGDVKERGGYDRDEE